MACLIPCSLSAGSSSESMAPISDPPKPSFSLETHMSTHFITNRLRLIQSKSNAPKPGTRNKSSKRPEGNRVFSLRLFFNLPLDLVFEVSSHLEPVDLLSLSRVSKPFRSFFMARSSSSIWRRVLEGVNDLPRCPEDLTEPQYASSLFDDFCMGCGTTRGSIATHYVLRLRLCKGCEKINLASGHRLRRHCGSETYAALSLLLASEIRIPSGVSEVSSLQNDQKMTYFLPEAKVIISELEARKATKEECPKEYDEFVSNRQMIASRIMNEGVAITIWVDDRELEKEAEEIVNYRREILQYELGWETRFFPSDENDPYKEIWDELIEFPAELITQGRNEVLPSLKFVYDCSRQKYFMELLINRITHSYAKYRARQPLEARQHMPPFMDVMYLECLNEFLVSHWDHTDSCTEEDMVPLFQEMCRLSEPFLESTKKELMKCLEGFDEQEGTQSTEPRPTLEDIGKARVVFLCSCDDCVPDDDDKKSCKGKGKTKTKSTSKGRPQQKILPYPDIVTHWVDKNDGLNWQFSVRDICYRPEIVRTAGDLVEALGLDREYSWAAAEVVIGNGLVCECEHVRYRGVIEYGQMIQHVYAERQFYEELTSHVLPENKEAAPVDIINGHSVERLPSLIRCPRPADQSKRKSRQGEAEYNYYAICLACYQVTKMMTLIEKGTENHHMRMMHGRAKVKGDMVRHEELIAQYGPAPPGWGKGSKS